MRKLREWFFRTFTLSSMQELFGGDSSNRIQEWDQFVDLLKQEEKLISIVGKVFMRALPSSTRRGPFEYCGEYQATAESGKIITFTKVHARGELLDPSPHQDDIRMWLIALKSIDYNLLQLEKAFPGVESRMMSASGVQISDQQRESYRNETITPRIR